MIFGIKTKKDRKIEELHNELMQERLRNSALKCIQIPRKTNTYQAEVFVDSEYEHIVPENAIRGNLALELVESFKKDLIIEREDAPYAKGVKYRARLVVVVR